MGLRPLTWTGPAHLAHASHHLPLPVGRGGGQRTAAEHAPAPPPASRRFPDVAVNATHLPSTPSLLSLTLSSLPRPLLPLPSTPERSSSSPTQITAATVHPVPPRWVQRNRHRLLRRLHQPIRPREPCSVFPELIPNLRPPATSPAIRRRLRFPEHAGHLYGTAVSP